MPSYSLHVRALLEHVTRNTLHAVFFRDLATGYCSTVHHGVSTQILVQTGICRFLLSLLEL